MPPLPKLQPKALHRPCGIGGRCQRSCSAGCFPLNNVIIPKTAPNGAVKLRKVEKRADGTSASAKATKKNAPQRKVGSRRRMRGAVSPERSEPRKQGCEHGCPDRDRMLEGKPAQSGDESANYSAKQISTGSKIEPNTTHKLQVLSKSNGSLRLAAGMSATKRGSARPPMRSAQ